MTRKSNEKSINAHDQQDAVSPDKVSVQEERTGHEIFDPNADVNFRTVGWIFATMIFLKSTFATGIMSVPLAMSVVGAVPGSINLVGWCIINTYAGVVFGNFRKAYPICHSVADMAGVVGGPIFREIIGGLFILTWVIVSGSCIVGASTAFNAVTMHSLCTNWFTAICAIICIAMASVRTFGTFGWLTWVGFISTFVGIFVVVVGVTLLDRPVAAPQEGPFDLGFVAIAYPGFVDGMNAVTTLFVCSAGTTAYVPVISEMRKPQHFNRALFLSMGLITASFLSFSLVVYAWCGSWVASPSLSSAGPVLKKVAYGIALPGLLVTGALYIHVSAKYLFVRILRNSKHLQVNSLTHWGSWLGCTVGLGIVSFLIAGGVPVFNFILSLSGAFGFLPLTVILPMGLYLWQHNHYRTGTLAQKVKYYIHVLIFAVGTFVSIGGLYAIVVGISRAYADGQIQKAFDCADNSDSV